MAGSELLISRQQRETCDKCGCTSDCLYLQFGPARLLVGLGIAALNADAARQVFTAAKRLNTSKATLSRQFEPIDIPRPGFVEVGHSDTRSPPRRFEDGCLDFRALGFHWVEAETVSA